MSDNKFDSFDDFETAKAYLEGLSDQDHRMVFTLERAISKDGPASVCAMKKGGEIICIVISDAYFRATPAGQFLDRLILQEYKSPTGEQPDFSTGIIIKQLWDAMAKEQAKEKTQ